MPVRANISHKVGDTFRVPGIYRVKSTGEPVDLRIAGIRIASAVKSVDGVVYPLDVVFADQDAQRGHFVILGDTSDWPAGPMLWDVQFTSAQGTNSSPTMRIEMIEDVTPAEVEA